MRYLVSLIDFLLLIKIGSKSINFITNKRISNSDLQIRKRGMFLAGIFFFFCIMLIALCIRIIFRISGLFVMNRFLAKFILFLFCNFSMVNPKHNNCQSEKKKKKKELTELIIRISNALTSKSTWWVPGQHIKTNY